MQNYPYWQQQTAEKPLFPSIEWSKPEQLNRAGKLGIIGGNKLGFAAVAEAYENAKKIGAGEVRVVLPDVLKKHIPASFTGAVFSPTNASGSLAREAIVDITALQNWAEEILLIGDAGRSSETAILYEQFAQTYQGPLVITRDAVDLLKNSAPTLVERPDTILIVSFAQLQKIFQSLYYPKMLTFSMQLSNLVEALHKFTLSYPCTIVVLHKDTLVVASAGTITTTPWHNPMLIWRGDVATKVACYWLWNKAKPLEAASAALLAD